MKRIRLYFQIFVSFCRKHPLAVTMYVVTMLMGLFSILFLYHSQLQNVQRDRGGIQDRVLTFSVMQTSPELWEYLENNEDIADRTLITRDISLLPEEISQFKDLVSEIGTDYDLVTKSQYGKIKDFSAADAFEVLLPTSVYEYLSDKQKLEEPFYIGDTAYHIVGYHEQMFSLIVPYDTFKQHIPVQKMRLLVKEESFHKVEAIQNDLMQKFGLHSERDLENIEQSRMRGFLTIMVLGIVAIFGNILFLVAYLFNLRDREFAIYRLLGITKLGLWLYMMLESIFVYLLNFGVAYGLYGLCVHVMGGSLDNSILLFTLFVPLSAFLLLVSSLFVLSLHRDRDREVYV